MTLFTVKGSTRTTTTLMGEGRYKGVRELSDADLARDLAADKAEQIVMQLPDDTLARLAAAPGTVWRDHQIRHISIEQRIAIDRRLYRQHITGRTAQVP